MQTIGAGWLYPVILVCGALQAWGPADERRAASGAVQPGLAGIVSFLPIVAFLSVLFFCQPRPLPTAEGVGGMPWWAPLGGLVGAFAVVAGLIFVDRVGAAVFGGLTITANILMSLAIDHFGLFGMEVHHLNVGRIVGGMPMVAGIALISLF